MITYLPFPSFSKTAECLHDLDLAHARHSAFTILQNPTNQHPCARMWHDYPDALIHYGLILCAQWSLRGHEDHLINHFATLQKVHNLQILPWWLYLPALSESHQSTLLARNRPYYSVWFKQDLLKQFNQPIFWPVGPRQVMTPF